MSDFETRIAAAVLHYTGTATMSMTNEPTKPGTSSATNTTAKIQLNLRRSSRMRKC